MKPASPWSGVERPQSGAEKSWQVVDQYVAAFEAARATADGADPTEFLPAADHPHYLAVLSELVRVDLELGWQEGANPRLENYRGRFPELFADSQRLADAAYEEYRLRIQAGEHPDPREYLNRFGIDTSTWNGQEAEVEFPPLGSTWGEFRLLRELGRGTFARVYLAQQGGLADRLVALKLSVGSPVESQTLAQLQHSNIVPIYSLHAWGRWQGLCMPFFGATTLADIAGNLRRRKSLPLQGRELVDTVVARRSSTVPFLRREDPAATPSTAAEIPTAAPLDVKLFDPLQRLSYVEAVLWIAARSAEGLAHAHARGIVHQDLKPANILLADDGRPMLLDFNLSTDVKRQSNPGEALVGGTLPYMAPEQLESLRNGQAGATAQSDIYSLGVVLFELLTGRSPFAAVEPPTDLVKQLEGRRGTPPRLRPFNRAVTPAVESIVRKCLAFDPIARYATADELCEDLDRQLAHRALRHAPNPSLAERVAKLTRRHGRLASTLGLAAAAVVAIAVLSGVLWTRNVRAERLAALAAAGDAQREARAIQFLFSQPDAELSERAEAERRATGLAQRYSLLRHEALSGQPLWSRLTEAERHRLAADLSAAAAFWKFDLEQRVSRAPSDSKDRAQWGATIAQLQRTGDWLASVTGANSQPLNGPRAAIRAGDLEQASAQLNELTREAPSDFAAWSLLGHCQMFLGKYREAEASFTVCRALWPDSAWPPYYRGQARYKAREFEAAAADFDLAIGLKPHWPEARYQRALTRLALRQPAAALEDLDAAQQANELPPLRLHCLRARIHQALGKRAEAANDLAAALAVEHSDDKVGLVSRGIAQLQMRRDARGALADFDAALALDPDYRAALENKAHVLSEQLGRTAEAIAVLNRAIELYPNYVAAVGGRGVLLAREGNRSAAHQDAERALHLDDGPLTLYQAAGVYALTSRQEPEDRERALELLRRALQQGYGFELLEHDADLDPLRALESFQQLARASSAIGRPAGREARRP